MKHYRYLKWLVNIIYYFHVLSLTGLIVVLAYNGTQSIKIPSLANNDEQFVLSYLIFGATIISYLMLLVGLFYFKKSFKYTKPKEVFSETMIKPLYKSGIFFIISSIVIISIQVLIWLLNASNGLINFAYSEKTIFPLFTLIIGLFFMLQSNVIKQAIDYKSENDLTI